MSIFSLQSAAHSQNILLPKCSSFFCFYTLPLSFSNRIQKSRMNEHFSTISSPPLLTEDSQSPSFETRMEPSIIIQSEREGKLISEKARKSTKKHKISKSVPQKPIQKDARNVASNLLRIFLKHVMEVRFYDEIIAKMIRTRSLECNSTDFYEWVSSFGINYKNYIRLTEVKRIFKSTDRKDMQSILRMLIRKYIQGVGLSHCLTSRRIDRKATAMHLAGLRQLLKFTDTE